MGDNNEIIDANFRQRLFFSNTESCIQGTYSLLHLPSSDLCFSCSVFSPSKPILLHGGIAENVHLIKENGERMSESNILWHLTKQRARISGTRDIAIVLYKSRLKEKRFNLHLQNMQVKLRFIVFYLNLEPKCTCRFSNHNYGNYRSNSYYCLHFSMIFHQHMNEHFSNSFKLFILSKLIRHYQTKMVVKKEK